MIRLLHNAMNSAVIVRIRFKWWFHCRHPHLKCITQRLKIEIIMSLSITMSYWLRAVMFVILLWPMTQLKKLNLLPELYTKNSTLVNCSPRPLGYPSAVWLQLLGWHKDLSFDSWGTKLLVPLFHEWLVLSSFLFIKSSLRPDMGCHGCLSRISTGV